MAAEENIDLLFPPSKNVSFDDFSNADLDNDIEYRATLTYVLSGIAGTTVCCLGTVANALSVAVLTRRSMRSSTYMYLASLAVCDTLVLLITLLLVIKDTRYPPSKEMNIFHNLTFPYTHPTVVMFQVTSIWLTLAFTVDRYIMICHPFKAEIMCSRSRARRVIFGIFVAGFIYCIPRYLEYKTIYPEQFQIPPAFNLNFSEFPNGTFSLNSLSNISYGSSVYGIQPTDFGKSEIFRKVMHKWLYLICTAGVPFFTLVVLNGFLIHAVRLSRLKGKELNSKEKHRNDTTIMLIGVIICFLICQGPALVSRWIYALDIIAMGEKGIYTLGEVSNLLVILNSAINIVPYYLFGRKFRREFWRLFCNCFFDKEELRRILRSYSNSFDRRNSQYNGMGVTEVKMTNGHNGHNRHRIHLNSSKSTYLESSELIIDKKNNDIQNKVLYPCSKKATMTSSASMPSYVNNGVSSKPNTCVIEEARQPSLHSGSKRAGYEFVHQVTVMAVPNTRGRELSLV